MSDSFEERGEFTPDSTLSPVSTGVDTAGDILTAEVELDTPEPEVTEPNGFELLGLAPELVQACADLGYVQPTAVQNAVFWSTT